MILFDDASLNIIGTNSCLFLYFLFILQNIAVTPQFLALKERFETMIFDAIAAGEVEHLPGLDRSKSNSAQAAKRRKKAQREAKEAQKEVRCHSVRLFWFVVWGRSYGKNK